MDEGRWEGEREGGPELGERGRRDEPPSPPLPPFSHVHNQREKESPE